MSDPIPPTLFCDFCGQSNATRLDDHLICDGCYIAKGSCCAGEDDAEDPCPDQGS